jgi:hypothetical protein
MTGIIPVAVAATETKRLPATQIVEIFKVGLPLLFIYFFYLRAERGQPAFSEVWQLISLPALAGESPQPWGVFLKVGRSVV